MKLSRDNYILVHVLVTWALAILLSAGIWWVLGVLELGIPAQIASTMVVIISTVCLRYRHYCRQMVKKGWWSSQVKDSGRPPRG